MSSEVSADIFDVNGALRFNRVGGTTPEDIPANGVLHVHTVSGSAITLGGGGAVQLCGIEYVDDDNTQIVLADDVADVKFFRVAPGVTITVLHNETLDLLGAALPAEQRIITSSGRDFDLEVINSQAFFAYVPSLTGFRWFFVDRLAYTPSTSADWSGDPTNFPDALDRLAAAVAGLLAAPIP